MTESRDKPAGIKEIAKALGVSIGTVDRALHQRPGINPMTRTRVLKMAQTLGYQPNFAARHLKLNRKLRMSVHLPEQIASFFDALRGGIEEAAQPFRSTIEVQFRSYPRLGQGDIALLEQALEHGTSGVILAPGRPTQLKPWIRKAAQNHVPVVCVATDAPGTERLTSISSDPYSSGALVAELLTRFVHGPGGSALVVTGDLSTVDHAEKLKGFRRSLETLRSSLDLVSVAEAHDDPEQAYQLTRECLRLHPQLAAVYVSTANWMPVVQAVKDSGKTGTISIITTDLSPSLAPLIRSGEVLGTIYQRPRAQGRMAFQALYQFLVEGICPPVRHRLAPHIVLQSNLDLFLEMLPADLDEAVAPVEPRETSLKKRGARP